MTTGSFSCPIAFDPEGAKVLHRLFTEEPRYVLAVSGPAKAETAMVRKLRVLFRGKERVTLDCGDMSVRVSAVVVNEREIWPIMRRKRS